MKERLHWKQDFYKRPSQCRPCAVIWSVLTELSRGMEKIIRRNVWGALKQSGPRDWPMRARPAVRRANFFLMNSTACSSMQSDCQGWTHIWSVFGGTKWQDQFCLQKKGARVLDVNDYYRLPSLISADMVLGQKETNVVNASLLVSQYLFRSTHQFTLWVNFAQTYRFWVHNCPNLQQLSRIISLLQKSGQLIWNTFSILSSNPPPRTEPE